MCHTEIERKTANSAASLQRCSINSQPVASLCSNIAVILQIRFSVYSPIWPSHLFPPKKHLFMTWSILLTLPKTNIATKNYNFLIGNTSSNGWLSIVMWVFRGCTHRCQQHHQHPKLSFRTQRNGSRHCWERHSWASGFFCSHMTAILMP